MFGGYGYSSLAIGKDLIRPFTCNQMETALHAMFDSNLGAPRSADASAQGAITQGTVPTDPPAVSKSVTGGILMVGGGPVSTISQRQHLVAPDSTTAETTAGGTILHRVYPIRGLLQELHIPQLHAFIPLRYTLILNLRCTLLITLLRRAIRSGSTAAPPCCVKLLILANVAGKRYLTLTTVLITIPSL